MQMVATLKQYSAMRNISVYRLRQLAKNGVITAGIVGNKYLLNVEAVDRYFEELGMHRLVQPAVVEIGGRIFCLGHGDGLGPVPRGYLFLRRIFHSRVLQFLFSMLHPWIAFRIGNGWSRNNRLARREKYVFRGEDEPLYRFADGFSAARHIDYFIFGHYHVHVDMPLPSGARLLVLDDWLDGSNYIYFDGMSGSVGYCQNSEK